MERNQLSDLLKKGPTLVYVAEHLHISRPTLYRQMRYYMNGEDSKLNKTAKSYFDGFISGEISNEEQAVKFLDSIEDFAEAEIEELHSTYEEALDELERAEEEYDQLKSKLSPTEKVRRQEEIDRLSKKVTSIQSKLSYISGNDSFNNIPTKLVWNKGAIRSVCNVSCFGATVYLDADYDVCQHISAELLVRVSGEDYPIAKYNAKKNTKMIKLDDYNGEHFCKYRIIWQDGSEIKTAGPYPIRVTDY